MMKQFKETQMEGRRLLYLGHRIDADMLFLYNDTERLHCIWDAAQSDHNR